MLIRQLAFWTIGFALMVSQVGKGEVVLDGIFQGSMELNSRDGGTYTVPLAVALTPTGETKASATGTGIFEEEQVIDGAFLIDEEGGPYSFTKVSYRLTENVLDLRYDRLDLGLREVPASFRLTGKIDTDGNFLGRVISGNHGPLGTFKLRSTTLKMLPLRDKYVGTWRGSTTIGEGGPLQIDITSSPVITRNPISFEFEYTPGRLATMTFNTTGYEISEVIMDYLRQQFYLVRKSPNGQSLIFQGAYDPRSQKLWGYSVGAIAGRTGSFALEKSEDQVERNSGAPLPSWPRISTSGF